MWNWTEKPPSEKRAYQAQSAFTVTAEVSCDTEAGSRPRSITEAKVYASGMRAEREPCNVSHSVSLPDEVDDLLAKLIVRGVDRQGGRLVIVSGEAQKSRTLRARLTHFRE